MSDKQTFDPNMLYDLYISLTVSQLENILVVINQIKHRKEEDLLKDKKHLEKWGQEKASMSESDSDIEKEYEELNVTTEEYIKNN